MVKMLFGEDVYFLPLEIQFSEYVCVCVLRTISKTVQLFEQLFLVLYIYIYILLLMQSVVCVCVCVCACAFTIDWITDESLQVNRAY